MTKWPHIRHFSQYSLNFRIESNQLSESHVSSESKNDRSSDPRGVRSDPKCKGHPADGFFRYDDRIYTFATWPKSPQFLLRDM